MMNWIIWAAVVNTVWTLWCARLLPYRVATRFGASGRPDGYMSRRGFTLFSIFVPLVSAAFLVYISGVAKLDGAFATVMQHFAAGFILFFSFLTWCLVKSNRRTPVRIDVPSLVLSMVALTAFIIVSFIGLPNGPLRSGQASSTQVSLRQ